MYTKCLCIFSNDIASCTQSPSSNAGHNFSVILLFAQYLSIKFVSHLINLLHLGYGN